MFSLCNKIKNSAVRAGCQGPSATTLFHVLAAVVAAAVVAVAPCAVGATIVDDCPTGTITSSRTITTSRTNTTNNIIESGLLHRYIGPDCVISENVVLTFMNTNGSHVPLTGTFFVNITGAVFKTNARIVFLPHPNGEYMSVSITNNTMGYAYVVGEYFPPGPLGAYIYSFIYIPDDDSAPGWAALTIANNTFRTETEASPRNGWYPFYITLRQRGPIRVAAASGAAGEDAPTYHQENMSIVIRGNVMPALKDAHGITKSNPVLFARILHNTDSSPGSTNTQTANLTICDNQMETLSANSDGEGGLASSIAFEATNSTAFGDASTTPRTFVTMRNERWVGGRGLSLLPIYASETIVTGCLFRGQDAGVTMQAHGPANTTVRATANTMAMLAITLHALEHSLLSVDANTVSALMPAFYSRGAHNLVNVILATMCRHSTRRSLVPSSDHGLILFASNRCEDDLSVMFEGSAFSRLHFVSNTITKGSIFYTRFNTLHREVLFEGNTFLQTTLTVYITGNTIPYNSTAAILLRRNTFHDASLSVSILLPPNSGITFDPPNYFHFTMSNNTVMTNPTSPTRTRTFASFNSPSIPLCIVSQGNTAWDGALCGPADAPDPTQRCYRYHSIRSGTLSTACYPSPNTTGQTADSGAMPAGDLRLLAKFMAFVVAAVAVLTVL